MLHVELNVEHVLEGRIIRGQHDQLVFEGAIVILQKNLSLKIYHSLLSNYFRSKIKENSSIEQTNLNEQTRSL